MRCYIGAFMYDTVTIDNENYYLISGYIFMIKILGISGSLRKASYNTELLRTACDVVPDGSSIETFDLSPLPLYNDDLAEDDPPSSVLDLRNSIKESDGLLIASPEYNYSFTGVLKNALDWASTDTLGNVMAEKPAAIMGASRTLFGTVRGQLHLRQALLGMSSKVVHRPEIYVLRAQNLFNVDGALSDDYTLKKIRKLLAALFKMIETKE